MQNEERSKINWFYLLPLILFLTRVCSYLVYFTLAQHLQLDKRLELT